MASESGLCAPSLWSLGPLQLPAATVVCISGPTHYSTPRPDRGPGPSLVPSLLGLEGLLPLLLLLALHLFHMLPPPFHLDRPGAESLRPLSSVLFFLSKCALLPLLRMASVTISPSPLHRQTSSLCFWSEG